MPLKDDTIPWGDPDVLQQLEVGGILEPELKGFGTKKTPDRIKSCEDCIKKVRLNVTRCCSAHPETGDVNPETGLCPNLEEKTGLCRVYETPDYPEACAVYFCPENKTQTK
jgi:hypothetical protein